MSGDDKGRKTCKPSPEHGPRHAILVDYDTARKCAQTDGRLTQAHEQSLHSFASARRFSLKPTLERDCLHPKREAPDGHKTDRYTFYRAKYR